jgi:hypothetical protein
MEVSMKNLFKKMFFIIIIILISFTILEICSRIYLHFRGAKNQIESDNLLGWKTAINYAKKGYVLNKNGSGYFVDITTNEYGFRKFGNVKSSKTKIFVIGDSFTHAVQCGDQKPYFSYLANLSNFEVFAYGSNGYGNLQEYLILNRYIDQINPDIILLQLCPNDIINNHYDLEFKSTKNNNGMVRPYLDSEHKIYYDMPKKHLENLQSNIQNYYAIFFQN